MLNTSQKLSISEKEMLSISERSLTLHEKLYRDYNISPPPNDYSSKMIEKWITNSAFGNPELFTKRLSWDDLSTEKAENCLGKAELDEPLEWVNELNKILEFAETEDPFNLKPGNFNDKTPFPFRELFIPFISFYNSRLNDTLKKHFSSDAISTLEKYLLSQLVKAAAQTLKLEFDIFISMRRSPLEKILSKDNDSEELYREFILSFYNGKFIPFFVEYSFLSRILVTLTLNWIEYSNELADRIANDHRELAESVFNGDEPARVVNLQTGLSDNHNNGKTVSILKFESGKKIVYKPKNLTIDIVFYKVVEWLNSSNELEQLKIVKTLDKGSYGWVEFIEPHECSSPEQVSQFYKRIGQLIFLVYLFEGTDCHYENIIASGDQPVIIDLETLFQPELNFKTIDGKPNSAIKAAEIMMRSVFATGFLPFWKIGIGGSKIDMGGLANNRGQISLGKSEKWININKDNMELTFDKVTLNPTRNAPFLNGEQIDSSDYLDDIIIGFTNAYNLFQKRKDELVNNDNYLSQFRDRQVRYVPRATKSYMDLIRKTHNPKYLRDGITFGIELESLCRENLSNFAKPAGSDMLRQEFEQLSRYDIPFFTLNTSKKEFYSGGKTIPEPGFILKTPYEKFLSKLEELSANDLDIQTAFIKGSFTARQGSESLDINGSENKITLPNPEDLVPITQEDALNFARNVADRLEEMAVISSDGSATWIALELMYEANALQLKPVGPTFHSGSAGIAFFLSSLYQITGDAKYKQLALSTLKAITNEYTQLDESEIKKMEIGIGIGIGSIIYGLSASGDLLDEEDFIKKAQKLSNMISEDVIQNDKYFDIIFGSAGCILALLKLYSLTKDNILLDKAVLCGDHILSNMIESPYGYLACPTLEGKFHTGFSHGAAGISYALSKLYSVTKLDRFKKAAEDEINYEQSTFDTSEQNYPDYRASEGTMKFMTSWCHGAPGIGLSRAASAVNIDDDGLFEQSKPAIDKALNYTMDELDQLCCGNAGRLTILNELARQSSDDNLLSSVKQRASYILKRKETAGGLLIFNSIPTDTFAPGLFTGGTGIAYALLNITHPGKLPNVLLYE